MYNIRSLHQFMIVIADAARINEDTPFEYPESLTPMLCDGSAISRVLSMFLGGEPTY